VALFSATRHYTMSGEFLNSNRSFIDALGGAAALAGFGYHLGAMTRKPVKTTRKMTGHDPTIH